MLISPERSSQWMIEFQKQLIRGKHVLLYGNVADQFLLNGRYLSLLQFLNVYFREEGYQIVGQYDIVDGLQLADPAAMQSTFDRIIAATLGGDPSASLRTGPAPVPIGSDTPPPAGDPSASLRTGPAAPQRRVPRA